MTMWNVGDIAVAKVDYHHDCGKPGCFGTLVKGRMYRVRGVHPAEDTVGLDIGEYNLTYVGPTIGMAEVGVLWDSDFFEKLVKSDEDIFKMADAPVKEDA